MVDFFKRIRRSGGAGAAEPAALEGSAREEPEVALEAAADPADLDLAAEDAAPPTGGAARDPQRSGKGHFFIAPRPLSAAEHGSLRVDRARGGFGFARAHRLIPLTLTEFPQAAIAYPIVFAGAQRTPCAVMGLGDGENLFIDADGAFAPGCYAPAYLRQHPFALMRDAAADRAVLLIDAEAACVSTDHGEPLFENGAPAPLTQAAMAFLNGLEAQWRATEALTARLAALDLFETKQVKLVAREAEGDAPAKALASYVSIAAERIAELSSEDLKDLAQKGFLAPIYAQQTSLFTWGRLIERLLRARAAA